MDYLPRSGRFDVAYRMLTRPESPGWLHMVQSERSTMSESINQNGPGSGHHPYGAYIGFWLYKYLGGIRPDEAKPGFREFVIEPGLDSGLAEVSVGCRSLYGEIVSAWKRRDGGGTLTIRVPANTVAELILPAGAVGRNPRVNGVRLRDIPSIAPIPPPVTGRYVTRWARGSTSSSSGSAAAAVRLRLRCPFRRAGARPVDGVAVPPESKFTVRKSNSGTGIRKISNNFV